MRPWIPVSVVSGRLRLRWRLLPNRCLQSRPGGRYFPGRPGRLFGTVRRRDGSANGNRMGTQTATRSEWPRLADLEGPCALTVRQFASCECRPSSLIRSQRRERSILNGLIRRTKKPPACTEGFVPFAKQMLSADRYTGLQIRWTNNRQRRLGHDQFDPEGIPAPEIRRRVRLAQCVHAGLFRSGGCFGETRQLPSVRSFPNYPWLSFSGAGQCLRHIELTSASSPNASSFPGGGEFRVLKRSLH